MKTKGGDYPEDQTDWLATATSVHFDMAMTPSQRHHSEVESSGLLIVLTLVAVFCAAVYLGVNYGM